MTSVAWCDDEYRIVYAMCNYCGHTQKVQGIGKHKCSMCDREIIVTEVLEYEPTWTLRS